MEASQENRWDFKKTHPKEVLLPAGEILVVFSGRMPNFNQTLI